MLEWLLEWWQAFEGAVMGATASPWALLVLFFLAIGDGAIPPLPSETFLSALGAAAASRTAISFHILIIVGAAGALCGDLGMYWIGRFFPMPLGSRRAAMRDRVSAKIGGSWSLILGMARFLPVVRVAIFLAAGAARIAWWRVALIDSVSALVWAAWFALSGFAGGVILTDHPLFGILAGMALGSTGGVLMGYLAQRITQRIEARATSASPQPTPDSPQSAPVSITSSPEAAGPKIEE